MTLPGPGVNGHANCAELTELLLRGDTDAIVQHGDLGVLGELAGGDVGGRGQTRQRLGQAAAGGHGGRGGGWGGAATSEGGYLDIVVGD